MMEIVSFDRLFVEEENFIKYKEIEQDENFIFAGTSHSELFILSLCLGYQLGKREKIKDKHELVLKKTLLNIDKADLFINCFKIIAKIEGDITDLNKIMVNKVMEEYANAGFNKLYKILNEPDSKNENLKNYLIREINL